MVRADVLERLDDLNLNKMDFIDWEDIPFKQDVRRMCEMNTCGNYGTNWMCPPAIGEFEDLRDSLTGYQHILMIEQVRALKDSFDFGGMRSAKQDLATALFRIRGVLVEDAGATDILLLGAGGCRLCANCNYPEGKPCRHPDRALPSVEGYGIHIAELCENTGFRYHNGENTVTNIGLVFFN